MRKILLVLILIYNCSYSQNSNQKIIAEYEDTLTIIAKEIMNANSEKKKRIANTAFIKKLKDVLKNDKSFKFPFDSLTTISRLTSPDKTFRIFNWLLKKDNGQYEYYAIIHYHNKKHKRYETITLIDNSENIRNVEQEDLDATNWYGCIYYQIAYIRKKGRKNYIMLGRDGNDGYSTKKIIDAMYFSGKNKIKFGLPIFKRNKKQSQKRVVLEYDSKTTISMRYEEKEQRIIFNNLIPPNKNLEGLKEYYIPDGTFNEFKYEKGKWFFKKDIDARNKIKGNKIKKIKKGLLPK